MRLAARLAVVFSLIGALLAGAAAAQERFGPTHFAQGAHQGPHFVEGGSAGQNVYSAQDHGEWRERNRDWLAVCPDIIDEDAADFHFYSCYASTGSQALTAAGRPAYRLSLIRNRLDGHLDIAITIAPEAGAYDPGRPLRLRFSGPVSWIMPDDLETRHGSDKRFFVADPERRAQLLAAIKEGAALTLWVPLKGRVEPVEIELSLQGVMASLDFMATHARRVEHY